MRRNGFTMIEVLIWLILASAGMLICGKAFASIMRVYREAPAAQESMMRFDSAMSTLRADARNGGAFVSEPQGRILLSNGYQLGGTISWWIEGDDLLRKSGEDVRRWTGAGKGTSLAVDGPCVVLHLKKNPPEEIRFVSTLQLAGRK